MKEKIKKSLVLLLSVIMLLSVIPVTGAFAATEGYYTYFVSNGEATITKYHGIGGDVVIPSELGGYPVTKIDTISFFNCTEIKSVKIPDSVTYIGSSAFNGCSDLSDITIPDSVTNICDSVFYHTAYYNDDSNWEDGVLYIGNHLIECKSDISGHYAIREGTKTIAGNAFRICDHITSVDIPEGVASIGDHAFSGCYNVTNIVIPDSVISIGDWAFCNLMNIYIGKGVKNITPYTFANCPGLINITVDEENENYTAVDGVLFNKDMTALIKYPGGSERTSYIIPDSLKNIDDYAFWYCQNLTNVEISNGVTNIGRDAFSYCKNLESVIIPDSVMSIGKGAFCGCRNLKSAIVSNSITDIADDLFSNCENLESVNIPDGVTTIGSAAFSSCVKLNDIIIPNSVISIGSEAFLRCSSLTSLTIPDSVTTIGDWSFQFCSKLKSIAIGKSVKNILGAAFRECLDLTNITVDEDNENFSSLDGVLFNKDKTELIQYPVGNERKSYEIPKSVTNIRFSAFECCNSIASVIIPEGVTYIEEKTFWLCGNLESVTIPKSVKNIGYAAFRVCKSLSDVYYFGSEEEWNNISIDIGNDNLLNATIHFNFKNDPHAHTFGKWTVRTAATCKAPGVEYRECDCGEIQTRTIAKLTTHTYDSGKVIKSATCKDTGTKSYTCAVCGKVMTETIAKLTNHTYKGTVTKATTSKNGKVESKCTVCGKVNKTTIIYSPKTVETAKASFTYTGKALKPTVVVKDSKGNVISADNYTVSYKNNKNVGTATVTVTFKGNYSGTLTATFKINPKGTSLSKLEATSKGFKATWKKQATQTTGYEIQYSTSKNFTKKTTKTVKIKGAKTVNKTVSKLKANTKYYVRIRTYKIVDGKTYYSDWSKVKNVKTK